MKISLLTVTWSYNHNFDLSNTSLYKSFKKFNQDKEIYHFHFNRGHYSNEETDFYSIFGQESEYLLYKIKLLLEKSKTIDSDYILFCDANDVTCLSSVDYLINIFDLDNYIIIGHEKNMWPTKERKQTWPDYEDYRGKDLEMRTYLNSGMILAKKEKYIEMLESIVSNVLSTKIKTFSNDQGVYTYYYNKNFKPEIKLDYSNFFVVNTFSRSTDEFFKYNNKLVCKETGIKPCFVHDNGWNHGSPKYHNFFGLKGLYSDTYDHLKFLSKQKPIPQSHQDYLIKLRDEFEFIPKVIYDIGACVMQWTNMCKEVWPNSDYYLFDAMEECEELFMESPYKYHIGVLSDSDDKEITFYKNVTFPGGNSYYLENPQHSSMAEVLFHNPSNSFKRKTCSLDTIIKTKHFPYPDLLKIDVQGCEIDILKGASEVLKNTKHLIVELQHVDYNIGAKLNEESVPIIESMGFELVTPKFSPSSPADADYHFKRKNL